MHYPPTSSCLSQKHFRCVLKLWIRVVAILWWCWHPDQGIRTAWHVHLDTTTPPHTCDKLFKHLESLYSSSSWSWDRSHLCRHVFCGRVLWWQSSDVITDLCTAPAHCILLLHSIPVSFSLNISFISCSILSLKLLSLPELSSRKAASNTVWRGAKEQTRARIVPSLSSWLLLIWCQRADTCHSSNSRLAFPLLQLFTGRTKDCLLSFLLFCYRHISTGRTLANNKYQNSLANTITSLRGRRGPLHPPPRLPQLWKTSWCRRVSPLPFLRPFSFSAEELQILSPIKQSPPRFYRKGDTIFLAAGLEPAQGSGHEAPTIASRLILIYLFWKLCWPSFLPAAYAVKPQCKYYHSWTSVVVSSSCTLLHRRIPPLRRSPSGIYKTRGSLDLLRRNAVGLLFYFGTTRLQTKVLISEEHTWSSRKL